jgi:transcriptional regulator with XRE-family HTH domain
MRMHDAISHEANDRGSIAPMVRSPTIGERIVRAREAAGIGQAEMARRLDVSTATAYRWEKDKVEIPVERLRAIAKLCGVDTADLIPESEREILSDEPVANDPEAHVRLAQLALAAAQGGEEAERKLNEAVKARARGLLAAERKRSL